MKEGSTNPKPDCPKCGSGSVKVVDGVVAGCGDCEWINGDLFCPTMRRASEKVSRNAPCPCGSRSKYKKCCIRKTSENHYISPQGNN